jgi:hypothetical protein
MTTIRRFVCDDLFRFNNVNLDPLTETVRAREEKTPHATTHTLLVAAPPDAAASRAQYNLPFYLQYLAKWPEYFLFAEGPGGACQGYSACTRRGAGGERSFLACTLTRARAPLMSLARSHGQGRGAGRELARPRDRRHGARPHTPHAHAAAAAAAGSQRLALSFRARRWRLSTAAKGWRRS